tara:strand:- start:289 stop:555 length:267 start_codon:yes stop_codon:yes gene_type:complete
MMELLIVILRVLAPIFLILGLGQELVFDLKRKFREKTLRNVKLHMAIAIIAMASFCFMVSPDGGTSGKVLAPIISGFFYLAFKQKGRT